MSMTAHRTLSHRPRLHGPQALLLLPLLTGQAVAGESTPSLLWSHEHNGETYLDYSVAIGNHGSEIISDTGLFTRRTRLYSASSGAGSPVWQASSAGQTYEHRAASSPVDNFHAVCRQEPGSSSYREVVVEGYRSSQATPVWAYRFPETVSGGHVNFCQVSADGTRVWAAVKGSNGLHVVALNSSSAGQAVPALDFSLPFFSSLSTFEISQDGSRAYLANSLYSKVYDTNSGALLLDQLVFGGGSAGHSMAADGKTVAYPSYSGFQVYRESGASFSLLRSFEPFGSDSNFSPGAAGLSADGQVLVAAFTELPAVREAHVFAWNVNTGQQLLHDIRISNSSSFQHKVSCVAQSRSATGRFAVGFWGDGGGSVPEILVYDRATPSALYGVQASFDRPGSVRALAISTDGTRLVTSGGTQHINSGTGNKVVESFDLGSQIRIREMPRVGQTVFVDFYPENNGLALILDSPLLAPMPVTMSIGSLYLHRPALVRKVVGFAGKDGRATLAYTLTQHAVGETRYFQGVSLTPSGPIILSDEFTALTVLP